MKISELVRLLDIPISPVVDFDVKGLTSDSRQVRDDFCFVAVHGNKEDGNRFIDEAISNGARLIVSQVPPRQYISPGRVSFIRVNNSRAALARMAAGFYGFPSRKLKVIGVTGTNGKTTITYLLEHIFKYAGYQTGIIGTINYRFKDKVIPAKNTTPGPEQTQALLAEMYQEDTSFAIMEVSSHALDQGRTDYVDYYCAIFTNLTQDHLDYHKDMEEYFKAKSLLFEGLNAQALAIINKDDPYAQRLINLTNARIATFSIKQKADIYASNIRLNADGTRFSLSISGNKHEIMTRLIGRHNVYNILPVFKLAYEEGIDARVIIDALESFHSVPGRLQPVEAGQDFKVFVDYAHTEDALRNVILSLRDIEHRRIIVVFGCGGDRDKGKRPKMGFVATELGDNVIITADNPRSEEVNDIIEDITRGIKKRNFDVIADRKEAINGALKLARAGDIVLIAGKGHENYQVFKDKTVPFDDREVAKECLKSLIS